MQIEIAEAFLPLLNPARYKVYYGGRGSAKSWTFATIIANIAYRSPIRVLCTREIQNSIEDSVQRLLSDTFGRLGYSNFFTTQKREIIGRNGSLFLFEGLRYNARKIKSFEGIDIAWVAEAEGITQASWDLLIPTIRKPASEIWVDFNPDSGDDPTYKMFVDNAKPDSVIQKVSWRDNPWFPEVLRREMEWDRAHDQEKYDHIWEGNTRTISDAQIFRGKYAIEAFDTPADVEFLIGSDWGFAQDPTTCIRMFIIDRTLYIDREAYGVGVEIEETPALFDVVLPHKQWPVRADSARPETISYMNNHGYNVIPAKKGAGSVEEGIQFLRSFEKIVVHPRCRHTADELKLYSYKTDRLTGDVLPIIVDKHNHCIDPMRYATEPIRPGRFQWGVA